MKRFLPRTLFLPLVFVHSALVPVPEAHATPPPYEWTVSASQVDPFVNTVVPSNEVRTIYLWMVGAAGGMATADFRLVGTTLILAATATNGFSVDLDSGQISHPECPQGPVIAAELLVLDLPGQLCFAPAAADGTNGAVLDCELVTVNTTEGAAYGAALLSGVGAGVWPDVDTACDATIQIVEQITPQSGQVDRYNAFYPLYHRLYDTLKPTFDELTSLVL